MKKEHPSKAVLDKNVSWEALFYDLYTIAAKADASRGKGDFLNERLARLDALCLSLSESVPGESPLHKMAGYLVVPEAWVCVVSIGRMIAAGLRVDAEDGQRRTALIIASHSGRPEMIEGLLANGAWVDHVDARERTALHWAAEMGHGACARILIKSGASARLADETGNLAWKIAKQCGHGELAGWLLAEAELSELATELARSRSAPLIIDEAAGEKGIGVVVEEKSAKGDDAGNAANPEHPEFLRWTLLAQVSWRKWMKGGGTTDTRSMVIQAIVDADSKMGSELVDVKTAIEKAVEQGSEALNASKMVSTDQGLSLATTASQPIGVEDFFLVKQCGLVCVDLVVWRAGARREEDLTEAEMDQASEAILSALFQQLSGIGEVRWASWAPNTWDGKCARAPTEVDYQLVRHWAKKAAKAARGTPRMAFPSGLMPSLAAKIEALALDAAAELGPRTQNPSRRL